MACYRAHATFYNILIRCVFLLRVLIVITWWNHCCSALELSLYVRLLVAVKVNVKVKFALEQTMKAQRWSRGIALFLL